MKGTNQTEHYTGLKLFSIWCGAVLLALRCWAVILLCLFSLKDFVEYLINTVQGINNYARIS